MLVVLILPAEDRDDRDDDGDAGLSPACAVSCWCRTAELAGAERVSSPAPGHAHCAVSAVLLLLVLLVCAMLLWLLRLAALQCGPMLSYLYPISPPSKY